MSFENTYFRGTLTGHPQPKHTIGFPREKQNKQERNTKGVIVLSLGKEIKEKVFGNTKYCSSQLKLQILEYTLYTLVSAIEEQI